MTEKYQGYIENLPRKHTIFTPRPTLLDLLTLILLSPWSFLRSFWRLVFGPGSYIQSAEKSFSMVKGGRTREAAALAWERQGPAPDRTSYKNWAKSVLDNPTVVEYKVKFKAPTPPPPKKHLQSEKNVHQRNRSIKADAVFMYVCVSSCCLS